MAAAAEEPAEGGRAEGTDLALLQELRRQCVEAAAAVRRRRCENEVLQAELRRALAHESIACRLHRARVDPGESLLEKVAQESRSPMLRPSENFESLSEEVALIRKLIGESSAGASDGPSSSSSLCLGAASSLSASAPSAARPALLSVETKEALLNVGASCEMFLTMAEATMAEEKKALQKRVRGLVAAREGSSPAASSGQAPASLPGRPPLGPSGALARAGLPHAAGLPECPQQAAPSREASQRWRRMRQLNTIASRLHDELRGRREGSSVGSSVCSPGAASVAASAPATRAARPDVPGGAAGPPSARSSRAGGSSLGGSSLLSKARSELRGRQLDEQVKALTKRFLLRRDAR